MLTLADAGGYYRTLVKTTESLSNKGPEPEGTFEIAQEALGNGKGMRYGIRKI